jgi:rod shape-determining protein MreD
MMSASQRAYAVVIASLALTFVLTVIPLPDWLAVARPEWVALTLIYWSMALPTRVGVGVAWTTGLFLDVLRGGLMGQQALSLCLVTFITLKFYRRIRIAPLWQQAVTIFILVFLHQLINLWVKGISGQPPESWLYWLPSFSSMLIWPLWFIAMRETRRHFRIS